MVKNTKHPGNDAYFGEITDLNENEKKVIKKSLNIDEGEINPDTAVIKNHVQFDEGLTINGGAWFTNDGFEPAPPFDPDRPNSIVCEPIFKGSTIAAHGYSPSKPDCFEAFPLVPSPEKTCYNFDSIDLHRIKPTEAGTPKETQTFKISLPKKSGTLALLSDISSGGSSSGSTIVGEKIVSQMTENPDSGAFVVENSSNSSINTAYTLNSIFLHRTRPTEEGYEKHTFKINLPQKSGTLALLSDIPSGGSSGGSDAPTFYTHTITFSGDGGKIFMCTFINKGNTALDTKEKIRLELNERTISGFGTDGTNLLFGIFDGAAFIKADGKSESYNQIGFNNVEDCFYPTGEVEPSE